MKLLVGCKSTISFSSLPNNAEEAFRALVRFRDLSLLPPKVTVFDRLLQPCR